MAVITKSTWPLPRHYCIKIAFDPTPLQPISGVADRIENNTCNYFQLSRIIAHNIKAQEMNLSFSFAFYYQYCLSLFVALPKAAEFLINNNKSGKKLTFLLYYIIVCDCIFFHLIVAVSDQIKQWKNPPKTWSIAFARNCYILIVFIV